MRAFLKIFFVVLLLAIVAGGGYLIYRYLFRVAAPSIPSQQKSSTPTMPSTAAQPIKLFSRQTIFDYWINTKTNAAYLVAPDGKITRTFGDDREEMVSAQPLPNLHRIIPAPDGTRALAHFGYPANDIFAIFDTETKSWERLPAGTVMASFDPAGTRIAYIRRANGTSVLYLFSLQDKKISEVMTLSVSDGTLAWNSAQEIAVLPLPGARFNANALFVNLANKTVRTKDAGVMLEQGPSSMGLRLMPSNGAPAELRFVRNAEGFEQPLPFLTLPSKCVFFAAEAIFCAVPLEFPNRAVLPDDYLKEKFFTQDSLIKYTIATGNMKTMLDSTLATIDAEHLNIRGKQMLFKNRYDEKLYAVELAEEVIRSNKR